MSDPAPGHGAREKRAVAWSSLAAAVVLTGTKLAVGLLTGSIGILSEAAHSGLDLVAAAVTVWAVRAAGRPADRRHAYGHGKFENLSALFETLLLLATCVWIVFEASRRLFFSAPVHVDANAWAFAIMALSIAIDVSRSRALARAAKRYGSQALEADALHFSTDVWSSAVVILGLVGVRVARAYDLPWLAHADAVAALGVAVIVVWVSLQLGRKTVNDLLDAAPAELREAIERAARIAGVVAVTQVRARRAGPETFADVTVTVAGTIGVGRAHEIASAVEAAVRDAVGSADVVVHVEPAEPEGHVEEAVHRVANRFGFHAHDVHVIDQTGGVKVLELHVEVDRELSLGTAHEQVSEFETELRAAAPSIARVVSHIEPAPAGATAGPAPSEDAEAILAVLRGLEDDGLACHPHDVTVVDAGGELSVSLHCALAPETSVTDAHALTVRLELRLRERMPRLGRVTIHVEPPESA
jgi:cation diffusion facilitator family transporter